MRIPADLRLPDSVKEVEVRACGQERIIAPLGSSWDSFFLDGPKASLHHGQICAALERRSA